MAFFFSFLFFVLVGTIEGTPHPCLYVSCPLRQRQRDLRRKGEEDSLSLRDALFFDCILLKTQSMMN
jgi:hypothetical protein